MLSVTIIGEMCFPNAHSKNLLPLYLLNDVSNDFRKEKTLSNQFESRQRKKEKKKKKKRCKEFGNERNGKHGRHAGHRSYC